MEKQELRSYYTRAEVDILVDPATEADVRALKAKAHFSDRLIFKSKRGERAKLHFSQASHGGYGNIRWDIGKLLNGFTYTLAGEAGPEACPDPDCERPVCARMTKRLEEGTVGLRELVDPVIPF